MTKIKELQTLGTSRYKPGGPNTGVHTLTPWRLTYTDRTVQKNSQTYHWCTKDHWSGGIVYNGMYSLHTTEEYDKWCAKEDKKKEGRLQTRDDAFENDKKKNND